MVSHTGAEVPRECVRNDARECVRNDASEDTSIYDGADTLRLNKAAYRRDSQSVLAT
jgi:hypothetical protein